MLKKDNISELKENIEPVAQSGQSTALLQPSDSSPIIISIKGLPEGITIKDLNKLNFFVQNNNHSNKLNLKPFAEQLVEEVENEGK